MGSVRAICLAVLLTCALGCSGPQQGLATQSITITDQRPSVRMNFGTLRLGMTIKQLQSTMGQGGWSTKSTLCHNCDVLVTPPPSDPAKWYRLIFKDDKASQLMLEFRRADPARVQMRFDYPSSEIQPDGVWVMTDATHQTLVTLDTARSRLMAIWLKVMNNPTHVDAILKRYFKAR